MNTPILPNEEIRITQGSRVSLHFEVSLMSGEVIDSTFHRDEPVTLTIGDESLLVGFEKVLMNLKAGDTRTAALPAEDAFGQWNPLRMFKPLRAHNLPYPNPTLSSA
ncbi:FKBP-type 16 kDa peptidyl-prolyl cis-trans isomerase [Moraxella veridica]|uniref:Peptidyl-prolyl cis-trans isomerase n=1 Tax=Moraxella catarrhalis TaxID=480 RepID=A0A7Z0UWT4_MORCA|nr:FKBP-type peptidyl-prolyl cis-trans isomerase slpA [Moraxella catarrhalis]STY81373.1 FKBP-type 16 kDa peptidyl-prolyl cis-trans isomerase [Moraxella catarrhalis]